MFLVAGIFVVILTSLALCEIRKPHDAATQHLFVYWCCLSLIFVLNVGAFYYFQVVFGSLESDTSIGTVVDNEIRKELQDNILSSYTVCCTGCDKSKGAPAQCYNDAPEDVTPFCNSSKLASDVNNTVADCVYAELCTGTEANRGLGSGCYASTETIPSATSIGSDTCKFLGERELDGKPLVGPLNSVSCGNGSPQKFLDNFFEYIDGIYTGTLIAWGFFIFVLFVAWFGAIVLITCDSLRDDK